jgi:4,5-DOPA dioxygenase extradiol
LARNHNSVIHYSRLGPAACLAEPTNEHYLLLLCVLDLQDQRDETRSFADKLTLGSMSTRSLRLG